MLEALEKIHDAKAGGKKRKRSTILPISMVQYFFYILFFSFCSNLSMWPGRQVVPDGSRCYSPIFDGLVSKGHPLYMGMGGNLKSTSSFPEKALISETYIYPQLSNLKRPKF